MKAAFVVRGAKTQAEADQILDVVMTGAHCSWPATSTDPSRLFVDYVVIECLKRGLLAVDDTEAGE